MKALALKYRPEIFEDVSEQEYIIKILKYQIETKTHKNCYLFTGGAGTGKTTSARIFAKELNNGKGSAIEIDAASNNGVDDVRKIIDEAKYKSISSEYKVYILDEVHMLSAGAWNAMLKLIEEPPAKTIFIMCTTDPQKIPKTILSRVQRYDFQRLSLKAIVDRLKYIIARENKDILVDEDTIITYEEEALIYIAKLSEGGMRDAIMFMDKCLSYSAYLTSEVVLKVLGSISYSDLFDLLNSILDINKEDILKKIDDFYNSGLNLKQFVKDFMMFLLEVIRYYILQDFKYVNIPEAYQDKLTHMEEFYDDIDLLLQYMNDLRNDIKWESNPKALIEIKLLQYLKEITLEDK